MAMDSMKSLLSKVSTSTATEHERLHLKSLTLKLKTMNQAIASANGEGTIGNRKKQVVEKMKT